MAPAETETLALTAQIQETLILLDEIAAAENLPGLTASVTQNKTYVYSQLPTLAAARLQISEIRPVEVTLPAVEVVPEETKLLFEKEGFWEEFLTDLSQLGEKVGFYRFLQYYYPGNPLPLNRAQHSLGKYKSLYPQLLNLSKNSTIADKEVLDKKPIDILYEAAPDQIKLALAAKFPKDFGSSAEELIANLKIVPDELNFYLGLTNYLRDDYRDSLLGKMAAYLMVRQKSGRIFSESEAKELLQITAEGTQFYQSIIGQATLSEILESAPNLLTLRKEANTKNEEHAESAKQLLEELSQDYYRPFLKRFFYKPAVFFWSFYLKNHPGLKAVPEEVMDSYLKFYLKQRISRMNLTEDQIQVWAFLESTALLAVTDRFKDIARKATQIDYFNQNEGHFLLLHQVEEILDLTQNRSGIVASEAGTGKTIVLAMTGLDLLKGENYTIENPGRILVAGTNSVINNWGGELGIHLEKDVADVININFGEDQDFSLDDRLKLLRGQLDNPGHRYQIILVNYDTFRRVKFEEILKNYNFEVTAVDEAHNVKSRYLAALEEHSTGAPPPGVARRTDRLYRFLQNNEGMARYLATATPYVKDLIEPLIMGNLVDPKRVTIEMVRQLQNDSIGTNRLLSTILVRHRKEDVSNLPPKKTVLIPISWQLFPLESQWEFIRAAQKINETIPAGSARFYSLLALEGTAKMPWLIETVKNLRQQGKNILVYSPFVNKDRYTTPISTGYIAEKLREAGIEEVGVLDGAVDNQTRLAIERSFKSPDGIHVVVGSHATAGESLTLNSPVNHATEVIEYVCPNVIHRYVQSENRVHRFGQTETVTIHVPYLTDDLLGRAGGTYDQQIVERIGRELKEADRVIDGQFTIESASIYQQVQNMAKPEEIIIPAKLPDISPRMAKLRFNPAAVSHYDYKKEMITIGLAEKNQVIFDREYVRIRQLQEEGILAKGENRAVEIAAMATFALASNRQKS